VLTRYLAGQLCDAEREAFETYYVEHPQMLQELEVAAKLKLGMALMEDAGELAAPVRRNWLPHLAAAAALLIAVIAGMSWFASPGPAPLLAASVRDLGELQTAPLAADTYLIERTRSRRFDARFELPPTTRLLSLRVLPEHPSQTTYGLRLNLLASGAAPREVANLQALRADAEGLITVYVDSGRLQAGSYEIILSADSVRTAATEATSSFVIQVEAAKRETQ
jgi:hypothetical protein